MNKFSALLDDITVINFPMIWKLIRRYRKMCLGVSCGIFFLSLLIFIFQSNIFSSSISFKAVANDRLPSPSLFVTQDDGRLKADIMRLSRSVDFYRLVATTLLVQFSMDEVLQGISKSPKRDLDAIQLSCTDRKDCSAEHLANLLPPFIDIVYGDREGNNFILTVRSVNAIFNRKLLDVVIEAINLSRIESRRASLIEQQQITKKMIDKNQSKLNSLNYQDLSRQLGLLQSQEKELEDKLKSSHNNLIGQMEKFDAAKSQLENRRQAKDRSVSLDDVEVSKRRRSLQDRVAQLTSDINAVEIMADAKSDEANRILRELKVQLDQAKDELSRMPQESRGYDNLDKFITSNDEKIDSTEFDFKVIQDQLQMARS